METWTITVAMKFIIMIIIVSTILTCNRKTWVVTEILNYISPK